MKDIVNGEPPVPSLHPGGLLASHIRICTAKTSSTLTTSEVDIALQHCYAVRQSVSRGDWQIGCGVCHCWMSTCMFVLWLLGSCWCLCHRRVVWTSVHFIRECVGCSGWLFIIVTEVLMDEMGLFTRWSLPTLHSGFLYPLYVLFFGFAGVLFSTPLKSYLRNTSSLPPGRHGLK